MTAKRIYQMWHPSLMESSSASAAGSACCSGVAGATGGARFVDALAMFLPKRLAVAGKSRLLMTESWSKKRPPTHSFAHCCADANILDIPSPSIALQLILH